MANRDGNGWIRCAQGHRHWGRFGAAGLLAYVPEASGDATVLLQRRSLWGNHPGTWGPPGGAMDSHESAVRAALREAAEECDIPAGEVSVSGILRDDHGGWSYQTVLAAARWPFPVRSASAETSEVGWIRADDVGRLDLHPGFAGQWPSLRAWLAPLTVIVDVANVMGSRPDGWWRDRAGAAVRLHGELAELAAAGIPGLPAAMAGPELERWFPGLVMVLEGAARAAAGRLPRQPDDLPGQRDNRPGTSPDAQAPDAQAPGGPTPDGPTPDGQAPDGPPSAGQVRAVTAAGSGDDLIAGLAARLPGRRLVVTADRELRGRCEAAGAAVAGPRWLLGML